MQGLPVAAPGSVVDKAKVEDPTIVRRTLKGKEVEKVTVENGGHRITFNLLTDSVEEITFPSHPNGSLADLVNLINRVVAEATYSINVLNSTLGQL